MFSFLLFPSVALNLIPNFAMKLQNAPVLSPCFIIIFSFEMGEFYFQLKEKLQNLEEQLWATSFQIIKVDNPYLVAFLIRAPIFEWYVVWCGYKNGYQKGIMCLKEKRSCVNTLITNLGSTYNIIGRYLYDHLMSTRILHFVNEFDIVNRFENEEANDYNLNLEMVPISY